MCAAESACSAGHDTVMISVKGAHGRVRCQGLHIPFYLIPFRIIFCEMGNRKWERQGLAVKRLFEGLGDVLSFYLTDPVSKERDMMFRISQDIMRG